MCKSRQKRKEGEEVSRKPGEYALYKGDDLLVMGTIAEIAQFTGAKQNTIRFYGTPTYKKICKGGRHRRELIRLEEEV